MIGQLFADYCHIGQYNERRENEKARDGISIHKKYCTLRTVCGSTRRYKVFLPGSMFSQ